MSRYVRVRVDHIPDDTASTAEQRCALSLDGALAQFAINMGGMRHTGGSLVGFSMVVDVTDDPSMRQITVPAPRKRCWPR
jgi:hypothetical protein